MHMKEIIISSKEKRCQELAHNLYIKYQKLHRKQKQTIPGNVPYIVTNAQESQHQHYRDG